MEYRSKRSKRNAKALIGNQVCLKRKVSATKYKILSTLELIEPLSRLRQRKTFYIHSPKIFVCQNSSLDQYLSCAFTQKLYKIIKRYFKEKISIANCNLIFNKKQKIKRPFHGVTYKTKQFSKESSFIRKFKVYTSTNPEKLLKI